MPCLPEQLKIVEDSPSVHTAGGLAVFGFVLRDGPPPMCGVEVVPGPASTSTSPFIPLADRA